MGCNEVRKQISLYLDGQLERQDGEGIKAHLDGCPSCHEYYKSIMDIKEFCNTLVPKEIPIGFHDRLWSRMKKEGGIKLSKKRRGMGIAIGLAGALLVIALGIGILNSVRWDKRSPASSGIDATYTQADKAPESPMEGNSSSVDQGFMEKPSMEMGEVPKGDDIRGEPEDSDSDLADVIGEYGGAIDRKIIRSAYLGIETLEFDLLTNNLEGKVSIMGGYIESSNIQGVSKISGGDTPKRRAHYEIRIPSKKFDQFINELGDLGNLITKEISGEDVTGQYFDTQARVKSLTIQEERVLAILAKAERLQDIIELEGELSRIRYEIENYTGTLKRLDQMVNYARIAVDVYEVRELKTGELSPGTLGERMADAFGESLKSLGRFFENLAVFLVGAFPYLVIVVPLVWIIWISCLRLIGNRNKRRKENQDE